MAELVSEGWLLNEKTSKQIKDSVSALYKIEKHTEKTGKKVLFDEGLQPVQLQVNLKKIPYIEDKHRKIIKIKFPVFPFPSNSTVCLFVKDLEKGKNVDDDDTVNHFKESLGKEIVDQIDTIMPLHMLKTSYKPFEAKRHLTHTYDVFLADDRIVSYLPKLLSKEFLRSKGFPKKVNLSSNNLAQEFKKVLHTTYLSVSDSGASSLVLIGHLGLSEEELENNISSALKVISKKIPGGWKNVKSLHIKTPNSIALPLYMSFGSANDVKLEKLKKKKFSKPEDVSTVIGGKVSIHPSGAVRIVKTKHDFEVKDEEDSKSENDDVKNIKRKKDNIGKKVKVKKSQKTVKDSNSDESEKDGEDDEQNTDNEDKDNTSDESEDEIEEIEDKHIAKRRKT